MSGKDLITTVNQLIG